MICRTCEAEGPGLYDVDGTRARGWTAIARQGGGSDDVPSVENLCSSCSTRLDVAIDVVVELSGGGDVRDEYISRLESALMAAEWDKALAQRQHPQWMQWERAMRAHPDWFVARALHDANRGDLVSVEIEAVPARAADYSTD